MKRLALLLLLAACSAGPPPYATSVGVLHPGETMTVRLQSGTLNAYAPAAGQRRDAFTVEAFARPGTAPAAPRIRAVRGGIDVDAPALRWLLVRVPQGVALRVISGGGDVDATDISGSADVRLANGNATLMLPAYGQGAIAGNGSMRVLIGSGSWPGTLRFSTANGSVDLSVNENAAFRVRLHTGNGTIFTDFNLRGTSQGTSETIVGAVNGGASRAVDVEVGSGVIRLLRLAPQY